MHRFPSHRHFAGHPLQCADSAQLLRSSFWTRHGSSDQYFEYCLVYHLRSIRNSAHCIRGTWCYCMGAGSRITIYHIWASILNPIVHYNHKLSPSLLSIYHTHDQYMTLYMALYANIDTYILLSRSSHCDEVLSFNSHSGDRHCTSTGVHKPAEGHANLVWRFKLLASLGLQCRCQNRLTRPTIQVKTRVCIHC